MFGISELFDEFGTNIVIVSDFRIIANGMLVDCVIKNETTNEIEIWAGNPQEDDYAEQIILDREERKRVFEEILENY